MARHALDTDQPLTFGLTHLALGVADVDRAFEFYRKVFGMVVVYRGDEFIQAQTPGARDVIVFEHAKKSVGKSGGIAHFGFRLTSPEDINVAAARVKAAGGTVTEQGEFVAGEPYLFAHDPDGYLFEVWFELPTSIDPK
jgi:catechol 2,3-dioxygenase-like lactoylglutathione lyase family enzyme